MSSYYRTTISWNEVANLESPYPDSPSWRGNRELASISKHYSLSPDPQEWGSDLAVDLVEADDYLHTPKRRSTSVERSGRAMSWRGLSNLGCMAFLILLLLGLFIGYPLAYYTTRARQSSNHAFNAGGTNATGQVPSMPGNRGLIDPDTPQDVYFKPSWVENKRMQLVFSDEFNDDGRTFYPGDDPYWEAVDLHYWATKNIEWYDPEAVTTANGSLVITLSEKETHGLQYQGGLVSTWNKFCFTGGYLESSVQLPGANNILGLWPAVWTMGNLGRAGYGASLEGMWPYTYDACDVGTAPNQTVNGEPVAATVNGDPWNKGHLSFLPGQRLSRCTCPGESHPGPKHPDGTFVGRAAPEIDVFEAQVNEHTFLGTVSQSAQWAPFNDRYAWYNTTDNLFINDPAVSEFNLFVGGITQQASSVVSTTNQQCYEFSADACFSVYGFEYKPGYADGYITWVSDNKQTWTMKAAGMAADPVVRISDRPIPVEPMYLIMNLGMSRNFGPIDFDHLGFPVHMKVDYVRVYQPEDKMNIGCDPEDFPTQAYINKYLESYMNPNLTTWVNDYGQTFPKSSILGQC